jgi:hypothetical protein
MRGFLCTWGILLALVATTAVGYDEQGRFMRGGGAGSISCLQFTSDMVRAQVAGGLHQPRGVAITDPYVMYVLGFQTGYNLAALRMFDLFAKWGDNPSDRALFWINDWCQKNTSKVFDDGIVALALTLRE